MKKFYFTFGVGQGRLAKHFIVIEALNYEEAREEMFEMFGKSWAFDYDESHWNIIKNSDSWNKYVERSLITDTSKESITLGEIFNYKELVL